MKEIFNYENLVENIIKPELEKIIEEEINEAKKRIDDRKAILVSSIMLRVMKTISIETMSDKVRLEIRVDNFNNGYNK